MYLPPPVFCSQKRIMPAVNGMSRKKLSLLKEKMKQESYVSRHKREEKVYEELPEAQLIVICDGFVTFFRKFKYLGSWISFSLRDDHDVAKRIASANASMGAMSNIWEDDHVDLYSKYLLFWAIPCNLLLWGCESWALRKNLLDSLEVFLHRGISRILCIKMDQVIDRHIKNAYIRENFTIPQRSRTRLRFRSSLTWARSSVARLPTSRPGFSRRGVTILAK